VREFGVSRFSCSLVRGLEWIFVKIGSGSSYASSLSKEREYGRKERREAQ